MKKTVIALVVFAMIAYITGGLYVYAASSTEKRIQSLVPNVVKVTGHFKPYVVKSGFGFVVAGRNNDIYICTANHTVAGESPEEKIQSITVTYHTGSGISIHDSQMKAELVQSYKPRDLAVLRTKAPPGFSWRRQSLGRLTEPVYGTKVWYIGRSGRWYVPTQAGSVNTIELDDKILVDNLNTQPGSSGAPLIAANGIVGMLLKHEYGAHARTLDIEFIRRAFTRWNLPWDITHIDSGVSEDPSEPPFHQQRFNVEIAGGPTGGTFYIFAKSMDQYISNKYSNVNTSITQTRGSTENITRIGTKRSDFGLCYSVDSGLGYKGKLPNDYTRYENLRTMGYIYGFAAQLVVRANSNITSAFELKGKRVGVGPRGSGALVHAERFLRHMNVWYDINAFYEGYNGMANAFMEGRIDAIWLMSVYPISTVTRTASNVNIRLVEIGIDAKNSGFYKVYPYSPVTIPSGVYPSATHGVGSPACQTFEGAAFLMVNKDVSQKLVYNIMKSLWSPSGMSAMINAKKTFRMMNLHNAFRGATVPLHPGAIKFWREQNKEVPPELIP